MTTDNEILKLTDYSHARIRTEMYLGSRDPHTQEIPSYVNGKLTLIEQQWIPAEFTALREILDNAFDEVIGHGSGDTVKVDYDEANCIFTISDNGRGIPISFNEQHKTYAATMALSSARAGRNFKERGNVSGTNGVGSSVVNFCSDYLQLDILRDNKHFSQLFEGKEEDDLTINDPVITDKKTKVTGTTVKFKLSHKVFKQHILPTSFVYNRLYEIAVTTPTLKLFFNGTQIKPEKTIEKSLFNGLKTIRVDVIRDNFNSSFWLIPNFTEVGEYQHAIINRIPAFNGGAHIDAFRKYFYSQLLSALEKESKKRKLNPNRSDITDGIMVFNVTNMLAPNFDSQSKTRLINEETEKFIREELNEPDFFKNIIKKYPEWIDTIYERCSERTMKKENAELAKATKKMDKAKVEKLLDATGDDRSKCILMIAEGLSAVSGSAAVRNPEIHGSLPLQGKILNVHGEHVSKILKNDVLCDIMNSLGLKPGVKAIRSNLRYGRVHIAHDADPDGYNIGALLINFFNTYWPELLADTKDPFLYIFMTPFIIAERGKTRKYWYSDDYHLFKPEDYSGWAITRAKGLGTLTEADWYHSINNPKVFPIYADDSLNETLDLIFNTSRADDRKSWMSNTI